MKTVCFMFVVAFAMENFCASAQQYTVSACKDGTLMLNCLTGLIQIDDVFLADSRCSRSSCCPRQDDCRGAASATYRTQVHTTCNGRHSCSTYVEIRKIGCSFWGPNNDYTNITYSCIAQTSPTPEPTTPTTPFPTTPSSSSASTRQPSTTSTSTPINTTPDKNKATDMGQQSTPFTPAPINTPSYTAYDKKPTEIEKEEGEMTSQSSVEESTKLNPTNPQKPGEVKSGSEHGKSASQVQTDHKEDNNYGYMDRLTALVSVIVGGVVITATVISVAVVLALKKRRIVKVEEEHYDMPNYSCNANIDDENVRTTNIYDFIPDSGNCSAGDSSSVDCSAKENDYLTPVMELESEEAPYSCIP